MPQTTAEQLEEVQTAISRALVVQSSTVDGASFSLANLSALQEREGMLLDRLAREQGRKRTLYRARIG